MSESDASGARHFRLLALEETTRRLLLIIWTTNNSALFELRTKRRVVGRVSITTEYEAIRLCLFEAASLSESL